MELQVIVRAVYGKDCIYPANDAARALAEIAGTVTLLPHTLTLARTLGHTVVEVQAPKLGKLLAVA